MVSRPLVNRLVILILLLGFVTLASAQGPDAPTQGSINTGSPVIDTITPDAFFDIFEFNAARGEQYRVDMAGADGLAPLVGLRDPGGDVIYASNALDDGTTIDALPNETATLIFEIPADGLYALVATRAGNNNGTTSGSYTLTMTLLAGPPTPDNTYVDVTFRCEAATVTTALVIDFGDQSETGAAYIITAYGFDGFDPVLRLGGDDGSSGAPCEVAAEPENAPELDFDFGGGESASFRGGDVGAVAVFTLNETDVQVRITVGSRSGRPGRFALQIQGLDIESAGDSDFFAVRSGPRAKTEPLMIWMLRDGLSRLDPALAAPENIAVCEDVALRTCAAELLNASVELTLDREIAATTNRLDSAARLDTGASDTVTLAAASQNGRTTGLYTLWLFGTLPEIQP